MDWTDENVERLQELISDPRQLSSAQIATELHTTRNSIVGKVSRLGWQLPRQQYMSRGLPRKPRRARILRIKGLAPLPIPRPEPVQPQHITLLDLEPHHCRWPYGDGPFTFCGHGKAEGSYCGFHAMKSQRQIVCEAA